MKAPKENQRELKIPNSLVDSVVSGSAPSSGSSSVHSYGLNLDTYKIILAFIALIFPVALYLDENTLSHFGRKALIVIQENAY